MLLVEKLENANEFKKIVIHHSELPTFNFGIILDLQKVVNVGQSSHILLTHHC